MTARPALRVATYNIHKCRGLDGRTRPERIAEVLRELDADILALQEVVCVEGRRAEHQQARYLAERMGYYWELGKNRRHRSGSYGNLLLSRFPIDHAQNYDISVHGRERRGCLRADLHIEGNRLLHVFNLHLGTSYFERRSQARKLFGSDIITGEQLSGHRIVLGDFNEWTKGLASRLLRSHFECADIHTHIGRKRSYPGVLPVLHLDHIYFDATLKLSRLALHRSRTALLASDHLPLVADLQLPGVPHRAGAAQRSGAEIPVAS